MPDQSEYLSPIARPLSVWVESSCSSALREIVNHDPNCMSISISPSSADVIVFENDTPTYIKNSTEFIHWPEKCIVISNTDTPSYFLPACYASNRRHFLGHGRASTIPFFCNACDRLSIPYHGRNFKYKYLYSFRGGSTSIVRKKLFKLFEYHNAEDVLIESSDFYKHWCYSGDYQVEKKQQQREYLDLMSNSLFILCPKGAGASSIRLFEVMQAGRVPVIISDSWIPVESIPWHEFAIFIPEKNIKSIDQILRSHQESAVIYCEKARASWEKYCSPSNIAWLIRDHILALQRSRNNFREHCIRLSYPLYDVYSAIKRSSLTIIKKTVLGFFYYTGLKFPYKLNRPIDESMNG